MTPHSEGIVLTGDVALRDVLNLGTVASVASAKHNPALFPETNRPNNSIWSDTGTPVCSARGALLQLRAPTLWARAVNTRRSQRTRHVAGQLSKVLAFRADLQGTSPQGRHCLAGSPGLLGAAFGRARATCTRGFLGVR